MMKWEKIVDLALIAATLVLGWQALGLVVRAILGKWFRTNEDFCTNVWLLLPFLAFRLKKISWRKKLQLTAVKLQIARNALLMVSATISVGFFFQPETAHSANWLESLERWGLNWIYIASWFFVPWLTWLGVNQALVQARTEEAERLIMDGPE